MEELGAFRNYRPSRLGVSSRVMKRTISALILSLIVAAAAAAQTPAPPAAAPPPKTIVQLVRDAIAENDFKKAEKLVLDDMAANGTTPIAIEAFSWLGRGLVAAKRYDEAMTYSARTYEIVEEQLKTRKLDDEARLPIALGAAIEVQALALAGQGKRSEAIMTLQREIEQYKGTSIIMRLNKNMNLLSLEGQPAFPIESQEWLGPKTSLAALKGKPVVLFLWAHWCGDCKTQGPILDALVQQVQEHRHHGGRADAAVRLRRDGASPAGPAEELAYIERIRDEFYPWMKTVSAPVSDELYLKYGVSTTPTYVMIDRDGKVSSYLPGQPTSEQLEAADSEDRRSSR